MRFRWFIGLASVLLAVIGTTVVVADRVDDGAGAGDQVIQVPADGTTSSSGPVGPSGTEAPPPAGRVRVTGTVTELSLGEARLDPRVVPTPLTLNAERGFGNGAEISGVRVAGEESTIVWDGGRPFVLSSGPGLQLEPVDAELTPDGLRLDLPFAPFVLPPGSYRLNTPVAVGRTGVATSRDAVTFEAGPDARLDPTGDTSLVLGPTGPIHLVGPGRLDVRGQLTIEGRGRVSSFAIDDGAYDLVLTPAGGAGWTIVATTDLPDRAMA